MALSKAAQKKIESTNGLDLIWESRILYAEILYCFRECHDVCIKSGLFTKDVILQVDQCALDFRQMSLDTVTVAKRVSNQWLDSAITFFENIGDFEKSDRVEMLQLLGGQARELAKCFKVIAAWARDLAGRFHQAQDGTIKEVEEFTKVFEAAVQRAKEVKEQISRELDRAAKIRQEAEETENKWKTAQVAVSWFPVGALVTGIGSAVAEKKTAAASELEREAAAKLRKSEQELNEKRSQQEKAQYVASKAGTLIEVLGKLEETCEAVAAFWTMEADNYDSQGAKMQTNQTKMPSGPVAKNNLTFWKAAKDRMDRYAIAMSVINNSFNFVTEAKPLPTKTFALPNLEFTLHVPNNIDIQKAIEERK